jgi:hypothetical protein
VRKQEVVASVPYLGMHTVYQHHSRKVHPEDIHRLRDMSLHVKLLESGFSSAS